MVLKYLLKLVLKKSLVISFNLARWLDLDGNKANLSQVLFKYIELSSNSNVEYVVELNVCFEFHFCAL